MASLECEAFRNRNETKKKINSGDRTKGRHLVSDPSWSDRG